MGHLDPFAPTKMTLGGLKGPKNGHLNTGPQNSYLLVLILSGLIDVLFILDYDSKCSETDFAQDKVNMRLGYSVVDGHLSLQLQWRMKSV